MPGVLQNLNDFLIATLGPLGPLMAIGVLGVLLVSAAIPLVLRRAPDPLDKLRQSRPAAIAPPKGRGGKEGGKAAQLRSGQRNDHLERFSGFLEPQDEAKYSEMRLKMLQAGYRSRDAVRNFHFAQFSLGIGFLILGVLYALLTSDGGLDIVKLMLSIVVPGGIGYYLPKYWIERRRQERQGEITNGFPDALDLLLVCVEAGQSMDQAIQRVSKEMHAGFPALAEEFEIVGNEIKAGKDKVQVLRDMAERAGVPDISSFTTVMIQSQTFGTSISDALRVYASEMRDKRVMRAEEKANVLPTKLTLGTMMFTVPPLLIILIGPSVFDIMVLLGGQQ